MSYRGASVLSGPLHFNAVNSPGISAAGEGRIYFDSTTEMFLVSENGGAYFPLGTAADITLQNAYDGGGVGLGRSVVLDDGSIQFTDNNADSNDVLQLNKTPASSSPGNGLTISMGANTTGNGVDVTTTGSGYAINATGPCLVTGKLTVTGSFDPTDMSMTGAHKCISATD